MAVGFSGVSRKEGFKNGLQKDYPSPSLLCACPYMFVSRCVQNARISVHMLVLRSRENKGQLSLTHRKLETWAALLHTSVCLTFHPRDPWHRFIKVADLRGGKGTWRSPEDEMIPLPGFFQGLVIIAGFAIHFSELRFSFNWIDT